VSREIWVFHRGALGDMVLLWPRLRHWIQGGDRVTLVCDAAKARLAEREVGVRGLDAEQRRFNQLWVEGGEIQAEAGVGLVVDYTAGSPAFLANLGRMFPGATIESSPPPRGGADAAAFDAAHPLAKAIAQANERSPIVLHVGAGSRDKQWPLDRWREIASLLPGQVLLVAGEVEAERFSPAERELFAALGGRFVADLAQLAEITRHARLFIGCDSGPTHLAAQLGVRTLALFGPTDPAAWAPIGPQARVIAPPAPQPMTWLEPGAVLREALAFLAG
jgi:hypothetical protein